MLKNKCTICLSENYKIFDDYINETNLFKNQKIYLCNDCKSYFSHFNKTSEDLSNYYTNSKNSSIGKNSGNLSKIFAKSISISRKKYIESSFINFKNNNFKKILEIGPGSGYFFNQFNKNEYLSYDAVEEDKSMHNLLTKLNINVIKFKDLKNNNYDLIILSHVLEHVIEPLTYLKELCYKLNNKGILYIDVPCEDFRYKNLNEPHLSFYNKETFLKLSKILSLKIISLDYVGHDLKKINTLFNGKLFLLRSIFYMIIAIITSLPIISKENLFLNYFNYLYKFDYLNQNKSRWIRCILEKS